MADIRYRQQREDAKGATASVYQVNVYARTYHLVNRGVCDCSHI